MGEGKLEELQEQIEEEEIDLLISNGELSGSQIRNIQEQVGVKVIDRSQLILDIFALRAKTKEGKLQVELAQYEYMLPRIHGQGEAMSRLAGGIGTRGPGESKLESDRRHIRRRMKEIKDRLEAVVKQREQYRTRRKRNHTTQVAIVGYTNAGKSTLFNALTNSTSLQEDKLFATLDPLTRQLRLPSGLEIIMSDTVGFIQDLPTSLVAAFRSTLEEVTEADFILHVIDASATNYLDHENTVISLLNDLEAENIPMLTIYNKKDLVEQTFTPSSVPFELISALDSDDVERVTHSLEKLIKTEWVSFSSFVSASEGKILDLMRKHSILTEEKFIEAENQYFIEGFIEPNHPVNQYLKGKN